MKNTILMSIPIVIVVGVLSWLVVSANRRADRLEKMIVIQQKVVLEKARVQKSKLTKEELIQKFIEQIGTNVPPKWAEKIVPKLSITNNKASKIHKLLETYIDAEPMPHFTQKDVSLNRLRALKKCTCDIHQPCWLLRPCTNEMCECCKIKR